MIGSQEVELGYGWNYADVLEPFTKGSIGPVDLADHIVASYQKSYERITNDYTLSAINLDAEKYLEENINEVAKLLIKGLQSQYARSVKNAIRASRNGYVCTHFDEPSYIDLHHFYTNLLANIDRMRLRNSQQERTWKNELKETLEAGIRMVGYTVFANTTGESLPKAQGISIYFPEASIYPSYKTTPFAQDNNWTVFLSEYLAA
ncbi:clostripain-related cysteine peptidase [Candidatus Dependentiae bacterium]